MPEAPLVYLNGLIRESLILLVDCVLIHLLVVDELVEPAERDCDLDHPDDHEGEHGHRNSDNVDVGQSHESDLSGQILAKLGKEKTAWLLHGQLRHP